MNSNDPNDNRTQPAIPAGTVFRIFRTAAGLSRTTVAREALVVSAGRLARIERGSQASPVELHMIGSAIGRLTAGMVGSR